MTASTRHGPLAFLVLALGMSTAIAQETTSVPVTVTAVSGRSIYLDAGRAQGIAQNDEVELRPPGQPSFRAFVREVSSRTARAEAPLGATLPAIGTPGEVFARGTPSRDEPKAPVRAQQAPAHPPWTAPGAGDPNDPLLAPAFGGGPASRPTTLDGRLFAHLLGTHDELEGGSVDTMRARLGARLELANPFGEGGRLAFDGEVTHRSLDPFASGEESSGRGRLDQLSYTWGDDEFEPWRVQGGRFVSANVPQLGLLDGVELMHRLDHVWSVGFGAGFTPLPFSVRNSGDDFGVHVFARWQAKGDTRAAATFGVQKTWHGGRADRDLAFARFDWTPADRLRFDGALKLDLYTASDDLESGALEITEAWLATNWRANDVIDFGLHTSTHRWPQLLREDWAFLPVSLIRDGHVERVSPRVGVRVSDALRLTGRFDLWRDQDRDGMSADVGMDLRDAFGSGFDLGASVYLADGAWQSGPGMRVRASRSFDWGMLGLRAEIASWESSGLVTGSESFTLGRAGFDLDFVLGPDWNALVDGELVFGDDQDGYVFGIFVQRRF